MAVAVLLLLLLSAFAGLAAGRRRAVIPPAAAVIPVHGPGRRGNRRTRAAGNGRPGRRSAPAPRGGRDLSLPLKGSDPLSGRVTGSTPYVALVELALDLAFELACLALRLGAAVLGSVLCVVQRFLQVLLREVVEVAPELVRLLRMSLRAWST